VQRHGVPSRVENGGGPDPNPFLANGLASGNLCNDMIDVHTADERIAVTSLECAVDVVLALVECARTFE